MNNEKQLWAMRHNQDDARLYQYEILQLNSRNELGILVGEIKRKEDAERIVACVNAFLDLSNEEIRNVNEFHLKVCSLLVSTTKKYNDLMKMIDRINAFDHAEIKEGEDKIDFLLKAVKERDEMKAHDNDLEKIRYAAASFFNPDSTIMDLQNKIEEANRMIGLLVTTIVTENPNAKSSPIIKMASKYLK